MHPSIEFPPKVEKHSKKFECEANNFTCFLSFTLKLTKFCFETNRKTWPAPSEGNVIPGLDPAYYALILLRQRKLDKSVAVSTTLLEKNPYDLQAWYMKTRA